MTCTPSPWPRSENALLMASIAALIVPIAALLAWGATAAVPDVKTTVPPAAFKASQALIVSRRAP